MSYALSFAEQFYYPENVHKQLKSEVGKKSWSAFEAWRTGNGPPAYEELSRDSVKPPSALEENIKLELR